MSRRSVLAAGGGAVGALLAAPGVANAAGAAGPAGTATARNTGRISVAAGQTLVISETTRANVVTIAEGGTLAAPSGYSLTMTVNGVETGQKLTATGAADTAVAPGTYCGDIVLTVAAEHGVAWYTLTFPFRQALYVGSGGVVAGTSVPSAVVGGQVSSTGARNISIASTGEAFNGVYVEGGAYTLQNPRIALDGNGRCDFVGYGAAVVGDGTGARVVLDGAEIRNHGAVRTAVVADNGATVIVKNSVISTTDGVLPADYVPSVYPLLMESAPWMLGISGNCRATNLVGDNTTAAYINSSISAEGWGVLSTDAGQGGQLVAVNCDVTVTGKDGYGSYGIGDRDEWFLGVNFDVASYSTINRGAAVYYADATPAAIAKVNSAYSLGLTDREIAAIPRRPTVINSRRWGMMWHGAGSVDVSGGTIMNTREATFLDKGQQVSITVDGSRGARLNPGNGIILQVMENDDPGPVMVGGEPVNEGVYTEPTGDPVRYAAFDVTEVHGTDAVAAFSDIELRGDFYNGMRGGSDADPGLNMALTFTDSRIEGVISATTTKHHISTITSAQYEQMGEVTNTVGAVVNNGVIVELDGTSTWAVSGTSYLSKLVVGANASVVAVSDRSVTLSVNGTATSLTPGTTYTGALTLTVN